MKRRNPYPVGNIIQSNLHSFGMLMKERTFESENYRYGFNSQEKDDEVAGSGNINTAEYWEYDCRLGRRWNLDPVLYAWQSTYSTFINNPILFLDAKGLYHSKERAEKMQNRAKKAGLDIGEVYTNGKDWLFNSVDGTYHKTRYFGTSTQKMSEFLFDINPFKDLEVYGSASLKYTQVVNGSVKVVVPIKGIQAAASIQNGGNISTLGYLNSYINFKVSPNIDIRINPLTTLSQHDPNKALGDWDPQLRMHVTLHKAPIIIPIGEVPIPIGEYKIQGDIQGGMSGLSIGGRAVAETKSVYGFSLEVAGGIRAKLQIPDIFKD